MASAPAQRASNLELKDVSDERMKEVCMQCGKSYAAGTQFCPQDGMELMRTIADPLIGTTLPRRYHIESLLGRGSMSVVYKGNYEPLNQPVAIKMLKSHLVSDPQQAKRFQHEVKTAGALNHPNIVGILDFGVTVQGVPYLIMDYLDGKSMSDILDEEGRLSVHRAIDLFSQTADALLYAHEAGVVHRDIKPSNLLICCDADGRETLKIVDFGIAKISTPGDDNASETLGLTATGEVLGTPLYMSPEQANGKPLDSRSDIYALGCVMYHALTGKPPFVGDTALDTMRLQISAQPKPIEQVRTDLYIPQGLRLCVMRALQKDPRNRYQTMGELREELQTCLPKRELATPAAMRKTTPVTPVSSTLMQTAKQDSDVIKLSFWFCALVIAGIALAAVFGHQPAAHNPAHSQAPVPKPIVQADSQQQTMATAQSALNSGQYATAEQLFKQVLEQKAIPDARQALALNGLASAYFAQDKLDEAKDTCSQALSIQQKIPDNDPVLADIVTNLSKICCAMGDQDGAERLAKQALGIRQSTPNASEQEQASALQCLAGVYCSRKNYKQADETLSKALGIMENAPASAAAELASIANDLGMVREREGKYGSAEQLFTRALSIRRVSLDAHTPSIADTLCALGTLYFNQKKDSAAENMFKEALSIRQSAFGEQSSRTAEVYSCLGILYDTNKDYAQAEQCYRKALNIKEQIWGSNSPKLLHTLQNLVKFLHSYHHNDEAAVYELQIKRIKEENDS